MDITNAINYLVPALVMGYRLIISLNKTQHKGYGY